MTGATVVWANPRTLRIERSIPSIDNISGLALSPDGRWLYAGAGRPPGAMLWDVARGERVDRLPRDAGARGAFSDDGKWLVTFGAGCWLWRVGDWKRGPALSLRADNTLEFSAAFHPGKPILAVTQRDREIHLIDLTSVNRRTILEGPGEGRIHGIQFSPDGQMLLAARDRGDVQVWNLQRLGAELRSLDME